MNFKIISRGLGALLLIETFFMLLSFLVSIIYGESDSVALIESAGITVGFGGIFLLFGRNAEKKIGRREAYFTVSIVWVIFSLFGSLPFVLSGEIPSFTDAFFETISGFTTTGSSILNDIEALPHGLLFWRSLTQWLGGMGIIVMSIAILPIFGIGGIQLFSAEVPGPTADKIHPRVKETAKRLWAIYFAFTVLETILLLFGGMSLFDAINHSLTTMATGGYSTKQASVAYWNSPYIQYVITIFMFIAGTNFTLSYFAINLKFSKLWKDEEFRFYLGFILFFTFSSMGLLLATSETGIEQAFRDSFFQVVSLITTTGYATADYMTWATPIIALLFVAMFFGGSAGSTGGGIKIVRIVIMIKNSVLEFKRLIHPNAIIPVRMNHQAIDGKIVRNVLAFIVFYIVIFFLSTLIMSFFGLDIESSMGAVIATLGNIGPGIGKVGPAENFYAIPDAGKWFLSFLMLIGRLELFTVLIILSPAFWRK